MRSPSNSSQHSSQPKLPPGPDLDSHIHQMDAPWRVVPTLPPLSRILRRVEWSTELGVNSPATGRSLCGHWMERRLVPFHRGCLKPIPCVRPTSSRVQHCLPEHSSQNTNHTSGSTTRQILPDRDNDDVGSQELDDHHLRGWVCSHKDRFSLLPARLSLRNLLSNNSSHFCFCHRRPRQR